MEEFVCWCVMVYLVLVFMVMVVVDYKIGDIFVSIGVLDLLDEVWYGYVDMVCVICLFGFILKFFIYVLVFEEWIGLLDSLIVDWLVDIGGYKLINFDIGY